MTEGHTPASTITNPKTHRTQWQLTKVDIAAFHQKFLTAATIRTEFRLHRNTVGAILRAAACAQFSPSGTDFGEVWLREAVETVLEKRRGG